MALSLYNSLPVLWACLMYKDVAVKGQHTSCGQDK